MTTINKSLTFNAPFTTSDGKPVAYFSANVNENGTNITMQVQDPALYAANKDAVRAFKDEFDKAVFDAEDEAAPTPAA